MKDENGNDRRNGKGNLVYQLGPHPDDLAGQYFHMPHPKTDLPTHLTIGRLIDDYDQALHKDRTRQAHFEVKFTRDEKDDIMSYNDIVNYMNRDSSLYDGEYWNYRKIIAHEATPRNHPNYKGSSYNLRVLWENGEHSDEPLKVFGKDAPVDCAIYAKKNGLLNKPGWRRFKRIAKREALLVRLVKQARLRSFCTSPKYKFGYEVPRDIQHALELDQAAGNNRWAEANKKEQDQLREYDAFIDKGKFRLSKIPRGYKQIRVHTIFDVKHDGRHKTRCVADGQLTDMPIDSVYSGVVSL